jgi:MoaA/NifB/PqqE/SkfB family radical SAM enzyme
MNLLNFRNYDRLWRVYGSSVLRYGTPKKVINALRTEFAYRRRVADVRSAPYILLLEPLYYCNLECPLCDRQVFAEARKNDAGKLSLALYDRVLDEIGDYLFQCQIFGQGEPTMNWRLTREIIERTHRRRIYTLLSTNCTLITPQMAEEVVGCGLDYLVCAVDGLNQESYGTYRVGGRVEDALAGMRYAVDAKRRQNSRITIEWQFLVHARNVHEIPEARRRAAELGVFLRLAPLRGMEWDKGLEDYWLPTSREWKSRRYAADEPIYDFPCYFLWRSLVLNSNGKAARCLLYQNAAQYADLKKMSALSAYNHPSVQQARRLFRKDATSHDEAPSPCRSCGFFARQHGEEITDRNTHVRQSLAVPAVEPMSFAPPVAAAIRLAASIDGPSAARSAKSSRPPAADRDRHGAV